MIAFIVDGRPVSQPRPRVTKRGAFMPTDYTEYREEVAIEAQAAALELEERGAPWDARQRQYAVRLRFYMPDARSTDLDKLIATQLDAFTRAGLWADDRYVTRIRADREIDRERPRVEIEIESAPTT